MTEKIQDEREPHVMGPCASADAPDPQTHKEARQFHEGYLAGLTAYARESGHSTLKRENELLRRLMDEQGWKTIKAFERLIGDSGTPVVPPKE